MGEEEFRARCAPMEEGELLALIESGRLGPQKKKIANKIYAEKKAAREQRQSSSKSTYRAIMMIAAIIMASVAVISFFHK